MTDQEAMEVIKERIGELTEVRIIKEQMMCKKKKGLSDTEIKDWLINLAIATLIQ